MRANDNRPEAFSQVVEQSKDGKRRGSGAGSGRVSQTSAHDGPGLRGEQSEHKPDRRQTRKARVAPTCREHEHQGRYRQSSAMDMCHAAAGLRQE